MGKPNLSAQLPATTLAQLDELKPLLGATKVDILIRAIDRLYRQEMYEMNRKAARKSGQAPKAQVAPHG